MVVYPDRQRGAVGWLNCHNTSHKESALTTNTLQSLLVFPNKRTPERKILWFFCHIYDFYVFSVLKLWRDRSSDSKQNVGWESGPLQTNRVILEWNKANLKLCSCLVSFASLKAVVPSELQPWLRLFSDSPDARFPEGLKYMSVFWPGYRLPVRITEGCCGMDVPFRHLAHQKSWTEPNRFGLIRQAMRYSADVTSWSAVKTFLKMGWNDVLHFTKQLDNITVL